MTTDSVMYKSFFDESQCIMLLIDPESGQIVNANQAACDFYGYSLARLSTLSMADINFQEYDAALADAGPEPRHHFQGHHRLSSHEMRHVDVYVSPIVAGERRLLATVIHDVTGRQQTERALEQAVDTVRTLSLAVEQSPVSVMITDPTGTIEYVNPRFCQLTGYSQEETIGQNPRLLKSGLKPSEEYAELWRTIFAGSIWTGTFENRKKNGDLYWEQASIGPIRNDAGVITHFVAVNEDITGRQRNEEARAWLAGIVESSSDAIIGSSLTGIIESWNDGAASLYGYSAVEVIGQPASMLVPSHRQAETTQIVARTLSGEHITQLETVGRHKNGNHIDVSVAASPIRDRRGTIVGSASIVQDIGARKQAEDALRELAQSQAEQARVAEALSEASAALATALEPEPMFETILNQMARVIPCTSAHIFTYRDATAIVAGSYGTPHLTSSTHVSLERSSSIFPQSAAPAHALSGNDLDLIRLAMQPWTGADGICSVIVMPLAVHGDASGCLSVWSASPDAFTDQHVRVARSFADRIAQALWNARQYQQEQMRAQAAERLAAQRSDFMTTVSHELRTPLTAILGYSEMLAGHWANLTDLQRLMRVQRIALAANKVNRLIDDLLRVSSLDSDPAVPALVPVGLMDVVSRAMEVLNDSYANQRIDALGPPNCVVLADASHTEQILINLLDNAAKYSEEGSPIQVIWAQEDRMVSVQVRDHGQGIPEEGRDILFSRFGRMPGSRMRAGRVGTGLGLFLGREFAEAMGGTLDLERTGPDGSVFCLRLPVYVAEPDLALARGNRST